MKVLGKLKLTLVALALTVLLTGCPIPFIDPIIVGTWILQSVNGDAVEEDEAPVVTFKRDKTFTQTAPGSPISLSGTWSFDRTARELTQTVEFLGVESSTTSKVEGGVTKMTLVNPDNADNRSEYKRQLL